MTFNKNWLSQKYTDPKDIPFFFFWGHQPSQDGTITKSCFSQWWVAPFEVDGMTYRTAEHWMMAGKARLFKDAETLGIILAAKNPADAKKAGRLVQRFDAKIWDAHKFDIVVEGNWHKFRQNETLGGFLAGTENRVLVEASPRDTIWGIGMGDKHPNARNPEKWRGENLLGFALMEVRDKLK